MEKDWFVYLIRCKDNSLYTGITNNILRRFKEHRDGKGAKYTRAKGVVCVEAIYIFSTKSLALKEEYRIKKLTKNKKEKMIKDVFNETINID